MQIYCLELLYPPLPYAHWHANNASPLGGYDDLDILNSRFA